MANEQDTNLPPQEGAQLTQVKVPLDEAADAFAVRDESGRIPIVLVPRRLNRIRNELVLAGLVILVVGIITGSAYSAVWTYPPAIVLALALIGLGVFRAFLVRIPEGASGLMAKGGKYLQTIESGTHIYPPWIAVSHLVTRREIPFDVPVLEAPTRDNVRASLDSLLTFTIIDPYRFVFTIATDDFDQVLQASCQETLRMLIRQVTADEVMDLTRGDTEELRAAIEADVERYGVAITTIKITLARPPEEFARTQEQRQLVVFQRAEQVEKQTLAERRQADEDALARQRLLAQIERERDELQVQLQQAQVRRQVVELEAETESLRLAKLEHRLHAYPAATQYDWESERLGVAKALAGNTRAVLQVGTADDIARALIMRDTLRDAVAEPRTTQADMYPSGDETMNAGVSTGPQTSDLPMSVPTGQGATDTSAAAQGGQGPTESGEPEEPARPERVLPRQR